MIDVTALLPYPYGRIGGQRYRIEQWQPHLEAFGIRLTLDHLFTEIEPLEALWQAPMSPRALADLAAATRARWQRLRNAPAPHGWLLYREATMMGPPLLERSLAGRAPLIVDFDDAIWEVPEGCERRWLRNVVRQPGKMDAILRMSRGASAGNAYLAEYAAARTACVEVVPSTVDLDRMYDRVRHHVAGDRLVIGWTGSHTTVTYLQQFLPVLTAVNDVLPLRLLVIGAEVRDSPFPIECRPWRADRELDDLLEMDVGIMPLPDDRWARGKCGMKAIQYMATGIPAVVSPVGMNEQLVTPGHDGFHATTPHEWHQALQRLADPQLRQRLGSNARETIRMRFSTPVGAARLASLVQRALRAAS